MKSKISKLIVFICLAAILMTVPAYIAAEPNDEAFETILTSRKDSAVYNKVEIIYANLMADGNVQAVYVVNHFEVTRAGTITDYGYYSPVINLSSTDPLVYTGGSVSFQAEESDFYYQGNLAETILPWNFDFFYYRWIFSYLQIFFTY